MDEKDIFIKKFENKLRDNLDEKSLRNLSNNMSFDREDLKSVDYDNFRKEALPKEFNGYEQLCNTAEKIFGVDPDKKTKEKFEKLLYNAHLQCSAKGALSASVLVTLIFIMIGMSLFLLVSATIGFGFMIIGLGSFYAMQNIPSLLARRMKTKASDEIIVGIFYIVAFMRFSSNFELAVSFAANYLNGPLSLDFKRLLWQLDNSEYPSIKEAFDHYLEDWRDENLEFLEAIYLIESSLYESEDFRRISLLDKALDTILTGNYEKMLNFAQELRGKVSTFNMMGVVLPLLGLIILPLAASFGDPKSVFEFIVLLYNIIFPAMVAYFGFLLIFNRPSSVSSIKTPKNIDPKLQKVYMKFSKNKGIYVSPKVPAYITFGIFMLIGLSPIIFHTTGFDEILNQNLKVIFGSETFGIFQEYKEIDGSGGVYNFGPYGLYPGLLSLFIPLAIAFGIGSYLKNKYKNLIGMRNKTKQLEKQFPSAVFQLGNRINEGISAELVFGAVAETMKDTQAGEFFSKIDSNIKFAGMSVEAAVFDNKKGAINEYPSDLVLSSMKIFVRANDRGPEIAAKTLIDLSKYLNEIHMSNERMKDLLAESLSSMKGQASFLAPVISGVVISIISLITSIMGILSKATDELSRDAANQQIPSILGVGIPTFLFQSAVGIYIVFLIIILVYMVTNLENGDDEINTKYSIGEKLSKGLTKYAMVAGLGMIIFTYISSTVLSSLNIG